MSEPKLISPLLDGFAMGDSFSDRNGIRTCPAMHLENSDKYIVKIISNPASANQIDALLLTGAYADREQAMQYYRTLSNNILSEANVLEKLSKIDGFIPFSGSQLVEADDGSGYDVYLLSPYQMTLDRYWTKQPMTHLTALNLGLDLCSALTVCRRCGYMYVALKPENIYWIEDKGFKIGDIGFVALDSLKYASLPDRYRSAYTAPEIEDVFASINTTVDVFAVGMILYRIFNGGTLPSFDSNIPSPEFADYEMAEIILKACAKNPEDRWEDPAQMGQALVSYMQRNGAHDIPIVPIPVELTADDAQDNPLANESAVNEESLAVNDEPAGAAQDSEETAQTLNESADETVNDFTFLDQEDLTAPLDVNEDETDVQISEEVSDILNQADELIAHETPAPVVSPEMNEVQFPETTEDAADKDTSANAPTEEETAVTDDAEFEPDPIPLNGSDAQDEDILTDETEYDEEFFENEETVETSHAKRHWVRNTVLSLLALCLLAGGFLFYKFFYLQHIDSLTLSGDDLSLTVFVKTNADESLLSVICYDTYGNQLPAPVVNGKAVFDELAPDCAYTVKVVISGFHSLTGQVAVNYSTPKQTNIIQFSAVTGAEDGSAVLTFSVDGPDLANWIIRRSAEGEETEDFPCSEHSYTFTGLTVGTNYTFEILSAEDKQIIGNTKITHTASKVITAADPVITSCQDGKLTVTWKLPADAQVSEWAVHCYNDKGYDQAITTDQLSATFENIIANDPYTVAITAVGMSAGQRLYVPENAVTISDFAVTATDSTSITLSWKNGNNTPENGWILRYSIDGSATKEVTSKDAESIKLTPYIPDCTYSFSLLTADSVDVIGGVMTYESKSASDFSGFSVKRSNMSFKMCLTPNVSNWDKNDVRSSDYKTVFKAGQKASFLVKMNKKYSTSSKVVYTTFVIRDNEGNIVAFDTQSNKWSKMWKSNYCEFDLPSLPKTAGTYNVTVYFNDAIAAKQDFRIK